MFADSGPPQAAQQNFSEMPNPRVTTTKGRIEVTDVRPETVTYSIETLINRLDGMNWDELYALRTFVCLETDPFQAYSGTVNNDLSHLNSWFVTVRSLSSADRNRLVAAICHRIVAALPNESEAPTALDMRGDR
jgi:hypothetical protein